MLLDKKKKKGGVQFCNKFSNSSTCDTTSIFKKKLQNIPIIENAKKINSNWASGIECSQSNCRINIMGTNKIILQEKVFNKFVFYNKNQIQEKSHIYNYRRGYLSFIIFPSLITGNFRPGGIWFDFIKCSFLKKSCPVDIITYAIFISIIIILLK